LEGVEKTSKNKLEKWQKSFWKLILEIKRKLKNTNLES